MNSRTRFLFILWCTAWAASALVVRILSEGILEGGDSIQHYQIARYSWRHPDLLLHHWGKPLFTLFASPFAQFGHWGVCLFNVLCLLATAWAADGILRRAGQAARWLFVPALVLVPVYGTMVFAGMTEVFFGLLTMLVLRALFDQRYVTAMVIMSFMPFARPEYIAFVPFAMGWVLMERQWRALPFALVGHVIYGAIGAVALGDALWAFHNDPYSWSKPIYGSGTLFHFTGQVLDIYGISLAIGLVLALGAVVWLWRKRVEDRPLLKLLLFVGVLPALGIWVIHSILWWKGLKGSLGLVRVIATSAPLVLLCVLVPIVRVGALVIKDGVRRKVITAIAVGSYIVIAVFSFITVQPLPVEPWPYDRFVRAVGEHVAELQDDHGRVIYFHPTLGYYADLDPYDATSARLCWGFDTTLSDLGLLPNDLIVWDAHFAPNEGSTPLSMLLDRADLELVELMVPEERMEVLGGRTFEVYLFARREGVRTEQHQVIYEPEKGFRSEVAHHFDREECPGEADVLCFQGTEFPLEMVDLPTGAPGLIYAQMTVSGEVIREGDNEDADLVFAEENTSGKLSYWEEKLVNGRFEHRYRMPARASDVRNKLYIWNRSGEPFRIKDLRVTMDHVVSGRGQERQLLFSGEQGFLVEVVHRFEDEPCQDEAGGHCFLNTEYPLELDDLPLNTDGSSFEGVAMSGDFIREGEGNTYLVFTEEDASGKLSYWTEELVNGKFEHFCRVPQRGVGVRNKLYIWNRSGLPFRIKDLQVALVGMAGR